MIKFGLLLTAIVNGDILGKLLFGYRGWFGAPGDGSEQSEWRHWSNGEPSCKTITIGHGFQLLCLFFY